MSSVRADIYNSPVNTFVFWSHLLSSELSFQDFRIAKIHDGRQLCGILVIHKDVCGKKELDLGEICLYISLMDLWSIFLPTDKNWQVILKMPTVRNVNWHQPGVIGKC